MSDDVLADLEAAMAMGEVMIVVRSSVAIAEVVGGPLRGGQEWLTLGDEGAGLSHVHVKAADVRALRFRHVEGRNAALDVLGGDGGVLLSVSFRRTNPTRTETFDQARLDRLRARFGHLTSSGAPKWPPIPPSARSAPAKP